MWIEYQRSILADHERNQRFHEALARAIVPGESVVLDIGSGTGFLGFLAAKLGAKEVIMVEHNPELAGLCERLMRKNRIRNCTLMQCSSHDLFDLPPVDIIVSETLGNYALEENILEILRDARQFLKPEGIMLPSAIEQFVAPVCSSRFHDELRSWSDIGFGLDYGLAQSMTFNNLYVRRFAAADLVPEVKRWDRVELDRKNDSVRRGESHWIMKDEARLTGFAVWWRVELGGNIALATGPQDPHTHWEQLFLPIEKPLDVQPGDDVYLGIHSDSRDGNGVWLRWQVSHLRTGETLSRQSFDLRKGGTPE